jgi:hypothetical protein
MDFVNKLGCEVQTTAAARKLAEMAIDFRRGTQTLRRRFPDVAVSMAVADTNKHGAIIYEWE